MKQNAKVREITIDLKGKSLGRAASETAVILRGKDLPDFEPSKLPETRVLILNLKELRIHPTKFRTKTYRRYSGYPSGLHSLTLKELWQKNPKEVFRHALWGMLPKNRLRKHIMKNLKFEQ